MLLGFLITADVTIPEGGAEGMIVTLGGRFGGYGLYLLHGKPAFDYNFLDLKQTRWEGGVTGVTINYPGSDSQPSRIVFGTEAIDVPVQITLFSAAGRATIVGTGNGRYEVH